ncbi:unnamed protein product, partial [Linum tenue]
RVETPLSEPRYLYYLLIFLCSQILGQFLCLVLQVPQLNSTREETRQRPFFFAISFYLRAQRQREKRMGWVRKTVDSVKSLQVKQVLLRAIGLAMVFTSGLILWKALMCMTGTKSPVVVVVSGSMEPGFKRGDALFLYKNKDPIRAGDIVVFNVKGQDVPIVHRVIEVRNAGFQQLHYCLVGKTGDANDMDDRFLYARGQLWLKPQHIMGRAVGLLPYVGWVTIVMTEKPVLQYILVGAVGLLFLTSKD